MLPIQQTSTIPAISAIAPATVLITRYFLAARTETSALA